MYRANIQGEGYMIEIKGVPYQEAVFNQVNCRVIGDVKIFDAHGILKDTISGARLARHVKKMRDSSILNNFCGSI